MSEIEFLTRLRSTAWRTMGARFNASRRLKRRDIVGAFSIAVFSMIGVGLTIIQRIYELQAGTAVDNFVTALSVLLGMFVVAISLIEWGYQGALKAEALYKTGEELTEFQRKLDLVLSVTNPNQSAGPNADSLRFEYEQIKKRCPFNHEPIDDRAFRAEHPADFGNPTDDKLVKLYRLWCRITHFLSPAKYFGLLWLIILGLLVATPWSDITIRTPNAAQQKH